MSEPIIEELPGQRTDIKEMVKWPGTPTMARIKRASALIRETEEKLMVILNASTQGEIKRVLQAQDDAEKIGILEWLRGFEEEAGEEIARAAREGSLKEEPELPERIAFSATDEELIGFCIRSSGLVSDEGRMAMCVSALMRDTDWIGLNAVMKVLKGLEVHIIEHGKKPGTAGLIIACDPGTMEEDWKTGKITGKTNLAIQKTVMWHGALSCSWHPNP